MNLKPSEQPTRIPSSFAQGANNHLLSGGLIFILRVLFCSVIDVPSDSLFCHQTVELAVRARLEDDRFDST